MSKLLSKLQEIRQNEAQFNADADLFQLEMEKLGVQRYASMARTGAEMALESISSVEPYGSVASDARNASSAWRRFWNGISETERLRAYIE